jgi:hypothetical protein
VVDVTGERVVRIHCQDFGYEGVNRRRVQKPVDTKRRSTDLVEPNREAQIAIRHGLRIKEKGR